MKTPWQYAETGNEFSHQVALFMWANMAVQFGVNAANDPLSYTVKGHAQGYVNCTEANGLVDTRIPELQWLHAIKNEGHGDPIRGARSAAEGVKAGVPDIFLPVSGSKMVGPDRIPWFHGLYIELKRPKTAKHVAGVVATPQTKWKEYLLQAGYAVETCYGWEAARDTILRYLGR